MAERDWDDITPAYLSKLAGIEVDEDLAAELVGLAIARAVHAGAGESCMDSGLKRRLETIENSLQRALKQVEGDDSYSHLIKSELLTEEARDQLQDLSEQANWLKYICEFEIGQSGRGRKRNTGLEDFTRRCRKLWIRAGGKTKGSHKSQISSSGYEGPLLSLIRELLHYGGANPVPSDATIHNSIARAIQHEAFEQIADEVYPRRRRQTGK